MSEIQRSDLSTTDNTSAADRDAKIEQLLLVGLDHYFAARYDQAINVWTRALFLDRSHPRARAYIERARSALAERQRQSEELLHDGVAAFQRGEGDEARRLLQAAIDGGAPADEALAVLDRLNRLDLQPVPEEVEAEQRPPRRSRPAGGTVTARGSRAVVWTLALMVGGLLAGGAFLIATGQVDVSRVIFGDTVPAASAAAPAPDLSLPVPRRGEMALAKARTLAASGRLHEALAALDAVRPTDTQRPNADQLRADIQRQLLALTAMPPPATPPVSGAVGRIP